MDSEHLQSRFDLSYKAQSDAIFRYCLLHVSDHDQALDISQETFSHFWQSLIKGTEIQNERAFLFTIAHHLVIDWYRKKKAIPFESLCGPDPDEEYEAADDKSYTDLEMEAEGRSLLEKIDQLSICSRLAVHLRFVEGLPPPEIAHILGISANAASVRINRGLRELRKLAGYGDLS